MSVNFQTKDWFSAATNIKYRAENLHKKAVDSSFVDTIFVDALQNSTNQVIYGRRGTGKTHLLLRVHNKMLTTLETSKLLPVYVDGKALDQSVAETEDDTSAALKLYVEFVRQVTKRLKEFVHDQVQPGLIDRIFGGREQQKIEQARAISSTIEQALTRGEVRILPTGEASGEFQTIDEAINKTKGALGVAASLVDPAKLGLKVEASTEKELTNSVKGLVSQKVSGETFLPFSELNRQIGNLLEIIGDHHLVVLFDEYSATGRPSMQPVLAQLLKLTLSDRMCIKLACIPGRTKLFSYGQPGTPSLGLELGEDITADVDLDSIVASLPNIKQISEFLMRVLHLHMAAGNEVIGRSSFDDFSHEVTNSQLEGHSVFAELCVASAAVVRDFLNLFRRAAILQAQERSGQMRLEHVRQAARANYKGKRQNLSTEKKSDDLLLLDKIYRKVVISNQTLYFLVHENASEDVNLLNLYRFKLVHRLPLIWFNQETMESFQFFQLDYGTATEIIQNVSTDVLKRITRKLKEFRIFDFLVRDKNLEQRFDQIAQAFIDSLPPSSEVDEQSVLLDEEFFRTKGAEGKVTNS